MRAGGGRRPPGASRVVGGLPSLPPPSDCAGAALLLPEPGPGLSGGQRGGQELHGKPRLSSQGALPGLARCHSWAAPASGATSPAPRWKRHPTRWQSPASPGRVRGRESGWEEATGIWFCHLMI